MIKRNFTRSLLVVSLLAPTTYVIAQATTPSRDRTPARTTTPDTAQDPGMNREWTTADRAQHRQMLQPLKQLEGTWNVEVRVVEESAFGQSEGDGLLVRGTSTREWVCDDAFLKEKFAVTSVGSGATPEGRESRTIGSDAERNMSDSSANEPRANQDTLREQQEGQGGMEAMKDFEGLGLYGYDQKANSYSHVWAESKHGMVVLSHGNFDRSSNQFTFNKIAGGGYDDANRGRATQPGLDRDRDINRDLDTDRDRSINTPNRPGVNEPGADFQGIAQDTGPTTAQPDRTRPGIGQSEPVCTLRIINDNQHVVRMRENGMNGSTRMLEITYTREGTTPAPREGTNPARTR